MAQGTIKAKAFAKKPVKPNPAKTRKGARVAKPKNATSSEKIQKKYSAGLVTKTERVLGERAGHLEVIGKGRDRTGKNKDAAAAAKGGSKKFG